jgi:hypothetical protein
VLADLGMLSKGDTPEILLGGKSLATGLVKGLKDFQGSEL